MVVFSDALDTSNAIVFELELLNRIADLERMSPWIEQCAETIGLSVRGTFRLQLLLEEVVMNIVDNAYDDEAEHSILVSLFAKNSGLVIQSEDDGRPFDPTEYPEVALPDRLDDAKAGGLGLHLVRSYADEYKYLRKDDKNILTLKLRDSNDEAV
ncbi:MAG: ATP-binding protein [Limnothrix sp.]